MRNLEKIKNFQNSESDIFSCCKVCWMRVKVGCCKDGKKKVNAFDLWIWRPQIRINRLILDQTMADSSFEHVLLMMDEKK